MQEHAFDTVLVFPVVFLVCTRNSSVCSRFNLTHEQRRRSMSWPQGIQTCGAIPAMVGKAVQLKNGAGTTDRERQPRGWMHAKSQDSWREKRGWRESNRSNKWATRQHDSDQAEDEQSQAPESVRTRVRTEQLGFSGRHGQCYHAEAQSSSAKHNPARQHFEQEDVHSVLKTIFA